MVIVDRVIEDPQERLEYEFVYWCRKKAILQTPFHPQHAKAANEPWVFRQDMMDIMSIVDFAMTNNLSNAGVEDMISLFQAMSEGATTRINSIPKAWRTLQSKMLEGFDLNAIKRYSFPVPPDLGFNFTEVPYVLKTYDCVLEEMLFNIETMEAGCFHFGEQPAPPGGEWCGRKC